MPGDYPMGKTDDSKVFFDKADLFARLENDMAFVRIILDESLQEIPRHIELVQELCKGDDFKAIRREAHTLKGLAANISTSALRDAAMRVEDAAKNNDMESVLKFLPELEKQALMAQEAIIESSILNC
jgi:HPt (histidine-containing phosphotransfer) domain-containing protein